MGFLGCKSIQLKCMFFCFFLRFKSVRTLYGFGSALEGWLNNALHLKLTLVQLQQCTKFNSVFHQTHTESC